MFGGSDTRGSINSVRIANRRHSKSNTTTVTSGDGNIVYGNYFTQGCHPDLSSLKDVVVDAIEEKLRSHLNRECLGSPMSHNLLLKALLEKITVNQGRCIEGPSYEAFLKVENDLLNITSEFISKDACT